MHTETFLIPAGVTVTRDGDNFVVKGPQGELVRRMYHPQISFTQDVSSITIATESTRRSVLALVGAFVALLKVMSKGVAEGYEYRMKIVFNHFPIQAKVVGDKFEISNFLGEKQPRYAIIVGSVKVKVQGEEVILTGINREEVGNTAANIEQACRVRNRDQRVFQDGIYITSRGN
ncbi:MAG TPA: 50S ribosomal protein L6 [Methanocorpusculum sp.]|nr:50S ribosomal protein L6 [Methanocorpusculum sp.]